MGRKMNDKNPTFQYSIIPAFQFCCPVFQSVYSVNSVAEMLFNKGDRECRFLNTTVPSAKRTSRRSSPTIKPKSSVPNAIAGK
jgi:hypothetical protein